MSPRELGRYHVSVPVWGAIVGGFTFLASFASLLWVIFGFYTNFMGKMDVMYAATMQQNARWDSVQAWHLAGIKHRSNIDIRVGRMDTTLHQVMAAMNIVQPDHGIGLFTEKRIHGHIIFEKLPNTTK